MNACTETSRPVFDHYSVCLSSLHRCGLRGGYVELVNLDPAVMKYAYTIFSTDICAPVTGQLALELMANPPRPGDPSYPVYAQVRPIKIDQTTV